MKITYEQLSFHRTHNLLVMGKYIWNLKKIQYITELASILESNVCDDLIKIIFEYLDDA